VEDLASDDSWSPWSRAFWGSAPRNKAYPLFIVAIIGLVLSMFRAFWLDEVDMWHYPGTWSGGTVEFRVPIFHSFILLWAVKMEYRPGALFRLLLVLLVIWSFIGILIALWFASALGFEDFVHSYPSWDYWVVDILQGFWMLCITILLWKRAGYKEYAGVMSIDSRLRRAFERNEIKEPTPKTLLIFIFVILTIGVYQDVSWIHSYRPTEFVWLYLYSGSLGFPLFWGAFTLLYFYRTEIEPWKEEPKEDTSARENLGISSHSAGKLMEAKELLDRGVISEEEFKQIKDDYLK